MDNTNLFELIERQYKSLEEPDYSFVSEAISSKPYDELVKQIQIIFETEEVTDLNEDVCFRYLLSRSGRQWIVELSMVGLYATILRLSEVGLSELVAPDSATTEEKKIYSLLLNYGVKLLGKLELEKSIALKLYNTELDDVCFYQALFSDTDILPWANQ